MRKRTLPVVALLLAVAVALPAAAQVGTLWYKEVVQEGRIYVFNDPNTFKTFQASKEIGKSITKPGYGPSGETVVFENETALDLYNIKHNRDSEPRVYKAPEPAKPSLPTVLKVADGDLKFGLLLQGWYVMDDSEQGSGSSYLGNPTGVNSFRLRRAEIKLSGKVTKAWAYEVMIDPAKTQNFASGADNKILQDFGIAYVGLKGHQVLLGQKKIATTWEGLQSSSDLDFVERSRIARVIGDQRNMGLFYKGDYGSTFGAQASITSGVPSNVSSTSDRLFFAGRFDVKPAKNVLLGVSGATGGLGAQGLSRDRLGGHVRFTGTDTLPLTLTAEYYVATDGQTSGTEIHRNGFYASALYTFVKQFRLGVRYEEYDANKDVANDELSIVTGGFHYMIKGKNINLKVEWYGIEQKGRKVNDVLDERHSQFVMAAQVSF